MQTGTISVQTENIFPIIKKFLYSDHEIFLRELVSNAVDATQKLKTLSLRGEVVGELGDLLIEVKLDADAKTLVISDKGIGMTHEEVEQYITQIAFSSARDFVEKYKDEDNPIIGNFGLGFFSAFMVADKVEIQTLSWQPDAKPVHWVSEGSTEYQIGEGGRTERGTSIILHLNDESEEFAKEFRVEELLKKYCRFLPVEIKFGEKEQHIPKESPKSEGEEAAEDDAPTGESGETEMETFMVDNIINNTTPAWTKHPTDLKDEDYINFYRELYPYGEDPLFWIHLNVTHPFSLTGILFFPKVKTGVELKKDRIHLYCNQVFVTDQVENIVPDYLMLLHGVIDSPDIPLNVSRSYLQSDPEVKKINKYISRKVADRLDELFRKERDTFNAKWEHTGILIKYGMISDEKFHDKARKFCLLETTDKALHTIDELTEVVKETQTDKNGNTVLLYANDEKGQHAYIQSALDRSYKVIKFDKTLDPHFISHLEPKLENIQFKRVDADTIDKLVGKDDIKESILTETQEKGVKELFEKTIGQKMVTVMLQPLAADSSPVQITKPEFMSRMKDMQYLSGGNDFGMGMPEMYNVIVNANHPVISKLADMDGDEEKGKLSKQLYDLALLQQNMLTGAELTDFVNRSVGMLEK